MKKIILFFISMCFICAKADNLAPAGIDGKCATFRVMQFNILQGWDSYNASETEGYEWLKRRGPVVKMFNEINPDIVCVQEARKLQCSYLKEQLPQYDQLLYPKDGIETNGGQRDLIMYKSAKFELLQWDKFWFSETPETSSYSWDAGTPKLTIRAQFRCKDNQRKTFWIYCTHFFPTGDSCRQKCSNMMLADMKANIPADDPIFLCGDLNLNYGDVRLDTLLTYMGDAATSAPKSDGPLVCTYNGFNPNYTKTLDHIYGRNVYFKNYHVVNSPDYGITYISDHYPLYSDVQIPLKWEEEAAYTENNELKLENKWFRAEKEPYGNIILSSTGAYKRGFAVTNDTIYISNRTGNSSNTYCYLDKYDSKTGIYIGKVSLSTAIIGKTYPCNDVIFDDAGHLLVYNYVMNMASIPLKLYQINPSTGVATLRATIQTTNGTSRVEHVTVTGDVETGNFNIYVPIASKTHILKFDFENGSQTKESLIELSGFYPTTVTKTGTSPRLYMLGDNYAVLNSSTTLPTVYNLATGAMTDNFGNIQNDINKLIAEENGDLTNGFSCFELKGQKYIVYPLTNYKADTGYQFVLASIDKDLSFKSMKHLWNIPQVGFGTTNNSNSEALITCLPNVSKDTINIYIYVPGNGLACYTLSNDKPTAIKTLINSNNQDVIFDGEYIKCNSTADRISVYDTTGKVVATQKNVQRINVKSFPKGLYVIYTQTSKNTSTQKIWIR